jgi:hypothetical protein
VTPILDGSDNGVFHEEPEEFFFQEPKESEFPTAWRSLDLETGVECRQLSLETFELRSEYSVIILDVEGFNLYRESDPTDSTSAFELWRRKKNVQPTLRASGHGV